MGEAKTYDLHVPVSNSYWANGLIVHNTFEGSLGWYPQYWRRWQYENEDNGVSFSIPTWSNTYIFPGGEDDPEIKALKATYPPALFQERFGAEPCPPSTLVFPEFRWDIHTQEDIVDDWEDFQGEIELAIDPGYNNPYAVLAIWRSGNMVRVVDEIYRRQTLGEHIISIAQGKRWWRYVTGGVIDVEARKHAAQKSQIELWEELTGLHLRSQFVPIPDGISRYRSFLDNPGYGEKVDLMGTPLLGPRIVYDRRCESTIAEHGKYKYRDIKEGKATAHLEKPIDASNHSLKAMAYYLVDVFGYVPTLRGTASQWQPKFPRRRRVYV